MEQQIRAAYGMVSKLLWRKRQNIVCMSTALPTAWICVSRRWQKIVSCWATAWSSYSSLWNRHKIFTQEAESFQNRAQGHHLVSWWISFATGSSVEKPLSYTVDCSPFCHCYSILKNYKAFMSTLEVVQQGHDEYAAKGKGLLTQMKSFETFFSLKLAYLIFAAAEEIIDQPSGQEHNRCRRDERCSTPEIWFRHPC